MNKNTEIPIFFAVDDVYAPFLSVALSSAIQTSSEDRNYKAIIMYKSLNDENRDKLEMLATKNFKIEFVAMQEGLESVTDTLENRLRCDYFTLTIFFRIFIPKMFPQYDKAIYIDCDIILTDDIAKLFYTDLGDNYIAACQDRSIEEIPELINYMENAIGVSRYEYINSGVLLMNCKKLRELNFDSHFMNLFKTYHFDSIAPDQDYINAICNGKIYYLGAQWNTMPNDNRQPLENPKLIHYNLFSKPWCYSDVQYSDAFWKIANESVYADQIKEYYSNYSKEQKKSDSKCLETLLIKGNEIPDQPITFKKMFEKGEKIRL